MLIIDDSLSCYRMSEVAAVSADAEEKGTAASEESEESDEEEKEDIGLLFSVDESYSTPQTGSKLPVTRAKQTRDKTSGWI